MTRLRVQDVNTDGVTASCVRLIVRSLVVHTVLTGLSVTAEAGDSDQCFAIEVVDSATKRGVPLVELTTVNHQTLVTDSNGLVAIDSPDLIGQTVFFHVRSHGYKFPKDGFGNAGKALEVQPGKSARLEIKRVNVAERLYRITGGGIYRDTVMLGRKARIANPLLNAKVWGSDSVVSGIYQDKIFWFWGDTLRPAYPLGNFHVTGATSARMGPEGIDPNTGVDFDYFAGEDGFARAMADVPGEELTWIGGLTVLRDDSGKERMYASYVKVRPPLTAYEHGLVLWNDDKQKFERLVTFPKDAPINLEPQVHSYIHAEPRGDSYIYFTGSFPLVRVPARHEALIDPSQYEGYTCLKAATRLKDRQLDRDDNGRLRYAWKRATPLVLQQEQEKLIDDGLMNRREALLALRDANTGRAITAHRGSAAWNEYRKRWVLIVSEINGESSHLGETWYAEADSPVGPWVYARKVVTHDKYSFYNPNHHPFLDQDGGRTIYFEGTYTRDFSGNPVPTPRYEYNQMMYKLDLADSRLNLPGPIYENLARGDADAHPVNFFALDRPSEGAIPVFSDHDESGNLYSLSSRREKDQPAFYALPVDAETPLTVTQPLYEFVSETSRQRRYSTDEQLPDFRRSEKPLCRVWPSPTDVAFPTRHESPRR